MQHMTDKCNEWKEQENIDYSVYGTPIESTTYKFAKCLKKRFGEIKDVKEPDSISRNVIDEKGMILNLYYDVTSDYYLNIKGEDGTKLWVWEYTDKYEIEELLASDGDVYKTGFELVYPENTEKSIIEEAFKNTLYSLCVFDEDKFIGFGRIIGDKTIFLYFHDIKVLHINLPK